MENANQGDARRPSQEAIAKRAYELFLQRGSVPGYELDDWLQAEAELTAAAARAAAEGTSAHTETPAGTARRPSGRDRSGARRTLRT
jgi:Protein of unknown function (DUF2934)